MPVEVGHPLPHRRPDRSRWTVLVRGTQLHIYRSSVTGLAAKPADDLRERAVLSTHATQISQPLRSSPVTQPAFHPHRPLSAGTERRRRGWSPRRLASHPRKVVLMPFSPIEARAIRNVDELQSYLPESHPYDFPETFWRRIQLTF
jgi:hypothetical protein